MEVLLIIQIVLLEVRLIDPKFVLSKSVTEVKNITMPGGRRGLVAPQNTFLENIIRRSNSQRKFNH